MEKDLCLPAAGGAYELIMQLKKQRHTDILQQLESWVNDTQKKDNKQHEVFEPFFDWKACLAQTGMPHGEVYYLKIKLLAYRQAGMHNNPCVAKIVCIAGGI